MGGGGANLLDSPKNAENSPIEDKEDDGKTETSWVTPTIKPFENYYTDFAVPSVIEETTIDGNGSKDSPYIINSTTDFLFLCKLYKDRLIKQYVELNCDIVLNDEIFDENGNCIGGDGVVYNWDNRVYAHHMRFNGNGHKISGVYYSDTTTYLQMFNGTIYNFENVNFDNVYFDGKQIRFIGQFVETIKNVNMYKGTIRGTGHISAYVQNANLFENCNNYFNIYSTGNTCGVFVESNANLNRHTIFKNCNNYGTIRGKGILGGFVGFSYNADSDFYNCNNYGEVISSGDYSIGGFVGIVSGKTHFVNCGFYGKVTAISTMGAFVGQCINSYGDSDTHEQRLVVKNCNINIDYAQSNCGIILGNSNGNRNRIISTLIDGCYIKIDNYSYKKGIFPGKENVYTSAEINNVIIEFLSSTEDSAFFIAADAQVNLNISNVFVKGKLNTSFKIYNYDPFNTIAQNTIDGVLVSTSVQKQFFGKNTSGYYVDFKTGQIGLTALSGKGFFQSVLTDEILTKKGYTKKEIA